LKKPNRPLGGLKLDFQYKSVSAVRLQDREESLFSRLKYCQEGLEPLAKLNILLLCNLAGCLLFMAFSSEATGL
jgi:hypothetical protein